MLKESSKPIVFSDISPEYRLHVSDNVVSVGEDSLLAVIEFDGMPFNTIGNETLERLSNRQVRIFNELGKINGSLLSVWCHLIKRKVEIENSYVFDNEFLNDFNEKYMDRFKGDSFFQTRYYISFVYKYKNGIEDGIKEVQQMIDFVTNGLSDFQPYVLGVKTNSNGVHFSEIGSFLSYLASGDSTDVLLSGSYLNNQIDAGSVFFGFDFGEFRPSSGRKRFAAFYDLRTHPAEATTGQWDFLLREQSEFVFSQSFKFYKTDQTLKIFDQKVNILSSASNSPEHLIDELESARPYISSGEVVFGEHQGALIVFGDTSKKTIDLANNLTSTFSGSGDTSFRRATNSAIFTYQSIFPASKVKPFKEPKSVRNLVCGFSLHAYPTGKANGNPLGDGSAVIPLKTEDGSIYFYNLHVTPIGSDNRGDPEAGHTLSLGQTGSGKTTLEAVIVNYLSRFNPALFAIDYNKSMINNIRGPLKGTYFNLEIGVDSGINPFQWNNSPEQRDFLYQLVEVLAGETTAEERSQIKLAVDTVMSFTNIGHRRLSHVYENIPDRGGNSLRERLAQWVYAANGRHAWALDCPVNKFDPDQMFRVGFDATSILVQNNPVTEPLLSTLFRMKEILQRNLKGNPLITMVAEFWAPANYPTTADQIKKILKAGRLKGEICLLSSQSPESALNCLIVDDIIQQTPTKNLLPNVDANWESYEKLGVSKKDFEELTLLSKESRKFIIKQGKNSAIASIDLSGFDEFMPIISSSDRSISQVDELIQSLGTDDPDVWLPAFRKQVKDKLQSKEN